MMMILSKRNSYLKMKHYFICGYVVLIVFKMVELGTKNIVESRILNMEMFARFNTVVFIDFN